MNNLFFVPKDLVQKGRPEQFPQPRLASQRQWTPYHPRNKLWEPDSSYLGSPRL